MQFGNLTKLLCIASLAYALAVSSSAAQSTTKLEFGSTRLTLGMARTDVLSAFAVAGYSVQPAPNTDQSYNVSSFDPETKLFSFVGQVAFRGGVLTMAMRTLGSNVSAGAPTIEDFYHALKEVAPQTDRPYNFTLTLRETNGPESYSKGIQLRREGRQIYLNVVKAPPTVPTPQVLLSDGIFSAARPQ